MVGGLTTLSDAWSHPGRFGFECGEALLRGLVSGMLALAGSFVLEDRARRIRQIWARMRAAGRPR